MRIAISLTNDFSKAKLLELHQEGEICTASDPANGDRVLSVPPDTGIPSWAPPGTNGEYEQFILDGNVAVFCSRGNNPQGNVYRFAATKVRLHA